MNIPQTMQRGAGLEKQNTLQGFFESADGKVLEVSWTAETALKVFKECLMFLCPTMEQIIFWYQEVQQLHDGGYMAKIGGMEEKDDADPS